MGQIASQAISSKLDELGTGENDVALCGGACGEWIKLEDIDVMSMVRNIHAAITQLASDIPKSIAATIKDQKTALYHNRKDDVL